MFLSCYISMQVQNSRNLYIAIITEFLEVAVHNIIYSSNLYPENVFVRKKKYAVSVQMCIHPKINNYIKQTLNAARHLLKLQQLFRTMLCFFDNNLLAYQFCFNLSHTENALKRDVHLLKAEEFFRQFCLRVPTMQNYFKSPLSGDAYFKILLVTTERASMQMLHNEEFQDAPFIQTEPSSNLAMIPLSNDFSLGMNVYLEKPL